MVLVRISQVRCVRLASVVLFAALVGACGGSGGGDASDAAGSLQVVAGFYPLAEAAVRVGGEAVEVENLTPAGVEPHDLELRPSQVDAVVDADVVLYLGGGFQPALAKVAGQRDQGAVDLLHGGGADRDPHFWLDPTQLADAADAIADALAKAAPEDASTFRANAAAYRTELEALDREVAEGLAHCERHDLVTAHAAFAAFAHRYGLTQVAVTGLSPAAEPDAARLADLADLIADRDVTTVFSETLVSPKVAQALAREANVSVAVLDPIEGLTKAEVAADADYATIMRRNLAVLRTALGCT
jgi:zinc transport system substrate-binding protein